MGDESSFGIKLFGSYSSKIEEMSGKYNAKPIDNPKNNNQSEYVFFDREGSNVGHAYRENIKYDGYNQPLNADAVVFDGDIMFGTTANDEAGLDKFDYIVKGNSQYAIDLNGNGIVDEDSELFNGKFDINIYRKAKADGKLSQYKQYLNIYKYGSQK